MNKLIFLLPMFLIGCASQSEMMQAYTSQSAIVAAQTVTTPVISLKCGDTETACRGLELTYNPRQDVKVPTVTNTNDVYKAAIQPVADVLTTGSVMFGAVRLGKSMLENAGSGNQNIRNTNIVNDSDNNTVSGTNDLGQTKDPLIVRPEIFDPFVIESNNTETTTEIIRE